MSSPTTPAMPAQAINRRAIQDALIEWLSSTTGLGEPRVMWATGKTVARTLPFAAMRWLSSTRMGTDEEVVEDLDVQIERPLLPDIRLWSTGMRRVVVSVQLLDDAAGNPEASGMLRLEAAIAQLEISTVRDPLYVAGFGFISATGIREVAPGQHVVEISGYVASAVYVDITSIVTIEAVPAGDFEDLVDVDDQLGFIIWPDTTP